MCLMNSESEIAMSQLLLHLNVNLLIEWRLVETHSNKNKYFKTIVTKRITHINQGVC